MLTKLLEFSLKNRLLVLLLFIIVSALGAWRLFTLPVDAFPDTTPIQVQINTVASALNPAEIEQQITLPVELSIGGLPGLINVRSVSKFGFSQVVATFDDNTNIIDARQYVFERINTVELPNNIDRPQLGPIASGLGEVFHYIVRSNNPNRSLEELRTLHDWIIKPELRKVPGVAEVNSWGGEVRQYHVVVSPQALLKFNLTLDDIYEVLEKNNNNVGGGLITAAGVSQTVHGLGRVTGVEQIEGIVIASYNGSPVRIHDVAEEVKIDHEIRRGAVTADGKGEAVLGLAFMLMGKNAQQVTEALKNQLDQVRPALPDDVILETVYDRTELTTAVIGTVKHNLFMGAVLVIATLFVLIGNLRAAMLVTLVIPLSLLFAALGMFELGIAASLLSLGAMDFGIIIDGSVVMTDANLHSLSERTRLLGRPLTRSERMQTLLQSSKEVVRPIAFGIGIILTVFLPILTLEGIEGKMFKPMAWSFMFALIGALMAAIMLSPVLSYYFLPREVKPSTNSFEQRLTRLYRELLQKAILSRKKILLLVLFAGVITGLLTTRLGGEFIPRLSEGSLVLNVIRLAGISIDQSAAYNTRIETILMEKFPDEVRHVWSRIGTAEVATDPMGTELTDIFISLKPRKKWTRARNQAELASAIQAELADLPGLNMVFTQPIELRLNEMVSGIRTDLGIKIYGDDFDELVRISDEIQKILVDIAGVSDIAVDQLTGQPGLQVQVDQEALARNGVPARHVLEFIEAIGGRNVGEVFEGQRHFDLITRLPDVYRQNAEELGNLVVLAESGEQFPLRKLATVASVEGLSTINREWGRRLIRVQCNVSGRDVSSFIEEAKKRIVENVVMPEGYVMEWGGQFENLERAQNRLMLLVPITLLLVFILLFFSMKSLRDVLLIYTGIPFALIGGVLALWLRGIPFSVSAAVGFIALSGLAVMGGQVLVVAIRGFVEAGKPLRDAVIAGGCRRLMPVLATAITDAAGFLPMALSTGVGAEVQRPLATVVIGGVITSSLLTLFILPILYALPHKVDPDSDLEA